MNYKLVEGHGIHECAKFQGFLLSHLATRGLRIVKKCKKQGKSKNTQTNIFPIHNLLTQ